ncbi:MAG TPA: YihY/virulence factor BrkB family protein [Kofleriaceae bacterium]|nr:YihY/virulence factor BrkB family protein [Kofleriaceae bacterium]
MAGLVQRVRHVLPVRVVEHTLRDDATVLAAGVALFLLLGLLPTLAAGVSIYALVADPGDIEGHLSGLRRVMPEAVVALIVDQLERAARRSTDELGLALAGSVILAVSSSRASANAVLTGIERVDGSPRQWTGWRRVALTISLAVAGLVGAVTVLAMMVALPAVSAALPRALAATLFQLRLPVLLGVGILGLSLLYRLGGGHRHLLHIVPGALCGTLLGLLSSYGVSWYVSSMSDYQTLYGAFGGAMIVIVWFYAVSLAVLIGAVVNVELRAPSA